MNPPQTLYFAYGSNLSLKQMSLRCPESRFIGRAVLHNFHWQINQRGYANVVPAPVPNPGDAVPASRDVVEGLCFLLSRSDEERLDRAEGVPTAYEKMYDEVEFFPATGGLVGRSVVEIVNHDLVLARGQERVGEGGERVLALVYASRRHTANGQPSGEYVGRMNLGIRDALALGVSRGHVDAKLRPLLKMASKCRGERTV